MHRETGTGLGRAAHAGSADSAGGSASIRVRLSRVGPILPPVGDEEFADYVASTLAGLPDVLAVSLGGSRASGTSRPDSDWDFAVYYRGRFDPDDLRGLGWPGEVSAIGGWGGGVFNGGAWLRVEGRPVDVHYRDLDDVEHQIAEAREGRFRIERLMFHLAGIPTYIVAAELALNRVLRGRLPRPEYPDKLRVTASRRWRADARLTLGYARGAHAARSHVADTAGLIATAAAQAAHAVLAGRGEWVTNEKTLLDRAGLRPVDAVLSGLAADPEQLARAVDAAERLLGLSPSAHLLQTWLPGDRYSGPAACGVDRARGRSYRGRRAARDRRGRGRRGTL